MSSSVVERRWHRAADGTRLELRFAPAAGQQAAAQQPEPAEAGAETQPRQDLAEDARSGEPTSTAASPAAGKRQGRPPLVFVHGSFHGAWCWAENFMPYFAAAGFDCHAISLRGHGGSELGQHHPADAAGTLGSHADDLASFLATLPAPAVLIVHSFGGRIAAKYVSEMGQEGRTPLAGLALLAAAPPSGTGGTAKRALWRAPLQTFRIAWSFIWKTYRTSPSACRLAFFSESLPQEELERWMAQLADHSGSGLPLVNSSSITPENTIPAAPPPVTRGKQAEGWPGLPPSHVFVGCGRGDTLVDEEATLEVAGYFGGEGVTVEFRESIAHDVMLDHTWEQVAASLELWLRALPGLESS